MHLGNTDDHSTSADDGCIMSAPVDKSSKSNMRLSKEEMRGRNAKGPRLLSTHGSSANALGLGRTRKEPTEPEKKMIACMDLKDDDKEWVADSYFSSWPRGADHIPCSYNKASHD